MFEPDERNDVCNYRPISVATVGQRTIWFYSVLLNNVACDTNAKTQTDVIYTDFKEAFDSVNHRFYFINSNYLAFRVICNTDFNLTLIFACIAVSIQRCSFRME